jgi:formylglycine-generating enzyme required for sulfatase activity
MRHEEGPAVLRRGRGKGRGPRRFPLGASLRRRSEYPIDLAQQLARVGGLRDVHLVARLARLLDVFGASVRRERDRGSVGVARAASRAARPSAKRDTLDDVRRITWASAIVVAFTAACVSFAASDEPPAPSSDGAAADSSSSDAISDAPADNLDGGDEGTVTITTASGARFAIDTTEVTVAAFRAFKGTVDASASAAGFARCAGKVKLGPKTGCSATSDDNQPMTCVDWCDAQAYCTSVGKRLCGQIGGGPLPAAMANDLTLDQWARACAGSKGSKWPYGGQPDAAVCNTMEVARLVPAPVGSFPQCLGGEPGLFDMSGNVVEWQDACRVLDGGIHQCLMRGGSIKRTVDLSACDSILFSAVSEAYDDVGFRCCKDL